MSKLTIKDLKEKIKDLPDTTPIYIRETNCGMGCCCGECYDYYSDTEDEPATEMDITKKNIVVPNISKTGRKTKKVIQVDALLIY